MTLVWGTLFATCTLISAQIDHPEELRELKEVPVEYRTAINLWPVREGADPVLAETITIGVIERDQIRLHGQAWPIGMIQHADKSDHVFLQISSKPDCAGGWDLILIHPKKEGVKGKWCYLSISYISRDAAANPDANVYTLVLDQRSEAQTTGDRKRQSSELFFKAYGNLQDIQSLVKQMPTATDLQGHLDRIRSLIDTALANLSHCDVSNLNNIHSGWGDAVRDKFIPLLTKLKAGLAEPGDKAELAKADVLIVEFDTWLRANWNKIAVKVSE